ncbi:MAG: hypothetical protein K6G26_00010 [Lachnospiraceae bacterium]|nr:hypothetical protein [Lachnospiraceae bacterium]
MKRVLVRGFIVCVILMCTGCTKEMELYTKLEENDTDVVADYMSGIVLKYQCNYDYRFFSSGQKLTPLSNAIEKRDIKEKAPSSELVIVDNEEKEELEKNGDSEENSVNENENDADINVDEDNNIASVFGYSDVNIVQKSYYVTDHYDEDGAYRIEANDGKKLLIVVYSIVNKGSKPIDIKINGSTGYSFSLISTKKEYLPLLTAAENDIMFLSATLSVGESIEAISIFQVEDDIDEENVMIRISSEKGSSKLPLVR